MPSHLYHGAKIRGTPQWHMVVFAVYERDAFSQCQKDTMSCFFEGMRKETDFF